MTAARPGVLVLAGAQVAQAALLLAQPASMVRSAVGDQDVPPPWIMRLLGARMLVQAAADVVSPRPTTLRVSAFVDVTHAASMVIAAKVWPRYRRAALASAISAASAATAAVAVAHLQR